MSTKRFEYNDDKSNKFWEISISENSHTVCYGRVGTNGQQKTKEFDSEEEAQKDADKLIKSKVKKGYVEVANSEGEAAVEGPGDKLVALLSPLCSTPADHDVLEKLAAKVISFEEDKSGKGTVVVQGDGYENEGSLQRGSKDAVEYSEGMPKSFCEIAEVVTYFTWDAGGPDGGYHQSGDDTWLVDEIEDDEKEVLAEIEEAGDGVVGAFLGGQGGNIFDPTTTLDNGEIGLYFISHEGGEGDRVTGISQYNYKQIFLRLAANALGDFDYIDGIRLTD
jgi:predicted DNA-binding WGR domain protein